MTRPHSVTILLIDDEPMMVTVIEAMLEHLNCQVLKTTDVFKALDIYDQQAADIDLVLVDQMMPRMTGLDLSQKLHERNPNVKVVLMTGSSVEDYAGQQDTLGIVGYLQKPFSFEEIGAAVDRGLAVQV